MPRLFLALLIVSGGCSAGYPYLPLDPGLPLEAPVDRPASVPDAASAFDGCAGVHRSEAVVHLACRNAHAVYAARFDAPVTPEACRKITTDAYPERALGDGPALALPPSSLTYRATTSLPAQPGGTAVVACVPARGGGLLFLGAQALDLPDSALVGRTFPSLAYDGVPYPILTSTWPDEVEFFGRSLSVHPSCRLVEARSLSCYPSGQMDWTEFDDLDGAQAAIDARVAIAASASRVLVDEAVTCTFEGIATECRRVTYRAPIPRLLILGASNVLIVYYAAVRVRGRAAFAVCSFFDDAVPKGEIAPLCAEAFAIPS